MVLVWIFPATNCGRLALAAHFFIGMDYTEQVCQNMEVVAVSGGRQPESAFPVFQ